MKYVKILGLAAVAAAALMAFVGAGTASAQNPEEAVLCKVTPTEGHCPMTPVDQMVTEGTTITSQLVAGTTAKLTPAGELPEDVCKKSTTSGKTESTTTPHGLLTLTFSECSQTTEVLSGGELTIHHDGEHNGTVTSTGSITRIKALFGSLSCDYGGEIHEGLTLTGGNPAILMATATVHLVKETGFISCPETAIWHGEYEVTSPKPLYVGTH
jgi:hypothetical protein